MTNQRGTRWSIKNINDDLTFCGPTCLTFLVWQPDSTIGFVCSFDRSYILFSVWCLSGVCPERFQDKTLPH